MIIVQNLKIFFLFFNLKKSFNFFQLIIEKKKIRIIVNIKKFLIHYKLLIKRTQQKKKKNF